MLENPHRVIHLNHVIVVHNIQGVHSTRTVVSLWLNEFLKSSLWILQRLIFHTTTYNIYVF